MLGSILASTAALWAAPAQEVVLARSWLPGERTTSRHELSVKLLSRGAEVLIVCEDGIESKERKEGGIYDVRRVIQVTDEVEDVREGRVTLLRSFDRISCDFWLENGASEFREASTWSERWNAAGELDGRSVRFRSLDGGAWDAEFVPPRRIRTGRSRR